VAAISISARSPTIASLSHGPNDKVAVEVMMWESSGVMGGPPANRGQLASTILSADVAQFVTKVKLANQK
jgi:hypothetical protein